MFHHVSCKCGFRIEENMSKERAETLADIHESAFYRRPYQHDARAIAVKA